MLWTFPFVWLVLALPFASAAVIGRVRPLRALAGRHHRVTWTAGAVGLCAFLAAFVGLLPRDWTTEAVFVGGALSGFACFWPRKPDDEGEDWRRWEVDPDREGPSPGPSGDPIDWQEFDRLRARWERGRSIAP